MALPNTTPTPNELFNGEMKKMSDAELRVTLIVTRATFGWVMDKETGMRKERDWISHKQMVDRSGKSSRSISYAVASCIENGWIEARDKDGNTLADPAKRRSHGKIIYYRLGPKFLPRAQTIAKNAKVEDEEPSQNMRTTIAKNDTEPSQNMRTTKEILTKETIPKKTPAPARGAENETEKQLNKDASELIDAFKVVNPSHKQLFKRKPQHEAARRLIKAWGLQRMQNAVAMLEHTNTERYAPTITTPVQLEEKLGALSAFVKKRQGDKPHIFA